MDLLNRLSDETPVLVDLKPTGAHYMEDLHAAGGAPAVLRALRDRLNLDVPTITGRTLGEVIDAADPWVDPTVVRPLEDPIAPQGGLVALSGTLAPKGAILRSEEHTSELQSLMRISYAVFCLKKKK